MMEAVALSLGANLGDRMEKLRAGVQALSAHMDVEAVSSIYETTPVGYGPQEDFLNAAVVGRTGMEPHAFLVAIQAVEAEQGRERPFPGAPRTLDIDIIFFGSRIIRDDTLTVPHPSWMERAFVLVPLAEIGADLKDPESQRTVAEIWQVWEGRVDGVREYAPPLSFEESK